MKKILFICILALNGLSLAYFVAQQSENTVLTLGLNFATAEDGTGEIKECETTFDLDESLTTCDDNSGDEYGYSTIYYNCSYGSTGSCKLGKKVITYVCGEDPEVEEDIKTIICG